MSILKSCDLFEERNEICELRLLILKNSLRSHRSSLSFLASSVIFLRKNAITDLQGHIARTSLGGLRKWNCIAEQSIPP